MIAQIAIGVFGLFAIAFAMAGDPNYRRFAPLLGLLTQPFWFYATISAEQWGMVFLCICYTVVWGIGFYNHWIRK